MKATINGICIEGSPEEIIKVLSLVKQEKNKVLPIIPIVKLKNTVKVYSGKHWSKEEEDLLRKNITGSDEIPWSSLATFLPSRTKSAVYNKIFDLGLANRGRYYIKNKTKNVSVENVRVKYGGNIIRFRFMNNRASYYMKQYNWSRSKALTQASSDWNNNKSMGYTDEKKVFPEIGLVAVDGLEYLEGVIKNCIENENKCINYSDVSFLPLINKFEWNFNIWKDFCQEFMIKSQLVCDYLNIENIFKIVGVGDNVKIVYSK